MGAGSPQINISSSPWQPLGPFKCFVGSDVARRCPHLHWPPRPTISAARSHHLVRPASLPLVDAHPACQRRRREPVPPRSTNARTPTAARCVPAAEHHHRRLRCCGPFSLLPAPSLPPVATNAACGCPLRERQLLICAGAGSSAAAGCVDVARPRPMCLPPSPLTASTAARHWRPVSDRCPLRRCRPAPPLQAASVSAIVPEAGSVAAVRRHQSCVPSHSQRAGTADSC